MSSTKSSTKANGTKSSTTRGASKATTSEATTSETPTTSGAPCDRPIAEMDGWVQGMARRIIARGFVARAFGWDTSGATPGASPWAAQFARPAVSSVADDFAEILVSLAGPCAESADLDPSDPDVAHAWAVLGANCPLAPEFARKAFEAAARALLAKLNPAIEAWDQISRNQGGAVDGDVVDVRGRFLNPRALPELRDVPGAKRNGEGDDGSTPDRRPGADSPRARYVVSAAPTTKSAPTFTTPAELEAETQRMIGLASCSFGPLKPDANGFDVILHALDYACGTGRPSWNLVALGTLVAELIQQASTGECADAEVGNLGQAAHVAAALTEAGNALAFLETKARNELLVGLLAARGAA